MSLLNRTHSRRSSFLLSCATRAIFFACPVGIVVVCMLLITPKLAGPRGCERPCRADSAVIGGRVWVTRTIAASRPAQHCFPCTRPCGVRWRQRTSVHESMLMTQVYETHAWRGGV